MGHNKEFMHDNKVNIKTEVFGVHDKVKRNLPTKKTSEHLKAKLYPGKHFGMTIPKI